MSAKPRAPAVYTPGALLRSSNGGGPAPGIVLGGFGVAPPRLHPLRPPQTWSDANGAFGLCLCDTRKRLSADAVTNLCQLAAVALKPA
jgi:hypothetical protein